MFLQSSLRSVILLLMLISPASTRERSRISLMSASTRPLLLSTISMYFMRSSAESVSAMTREKPSMALRGVRISWLMLARKSDFMRLASSAFFAFSSYSLSLCFAASNSFWIACILAFASANFRRSISFSSWFIF